MAARLQKSITVGVLIATGVFSNVAYGQSVENEVRDVVLLLDSGPLHLRFRIQLDGMTLEQHRLRYIESLMVRLDRNKDGTITRRETIDSPLFNARRRVTDNPFLEKLDVDREFSRRDIELNIARIGGETVSYRQDESAADNGLEFFRVIDEDESGQIERDEMAAAAARVVKLDTDRDQCIGFDEFRLATAQPETAVNALPERQNEPESNPTAASIVRDMREPLLPLRIVRQFDINRDGRLSAAEIKWPQERFKSLDVDNDGYLTNRELKALVDSAVDVDLLVNLSGDPDKSAIQVVGPGGEHQLQSSRPDLVRMSLAQTNVSFSFRNVDPIKDAVANAMRTFNLIDVDVNGYIDRSEIADRFRFERYLFEALDQDNDDKVFAEEMKKYIEVRGEPMAMTCQVNTYNTGNGFFQLLDSNSDGRISIRELRGMEGNLLEACSSPDAALTPADSGQHYHIEFVRGTFHLFGRSQRMAFEGSTFIQRPPVGPIWFQRMDRNSDGDLTWQEFLGPRQAFDAFDVDRDGLIDAREALRDIGL